ncbi:MAG: extracellular solute-binding protein [Thermomicrobiales bacterium]
MIMTMTPLSRRKVMQVGAAAAGLTLLPSSRRTRAQDTTVTFWNPGILMVEDPSDKTKKPEDFYVYQAIARFEAANPGVKIAMEVLPGDANQFTKYRTASIAANGPDVMAMWSGSYMLGVKDFLEPLASYFTAEERARILGWEATSADFKPDSTEICGIPAGSDGQTCIFYNTELLDKAGIDPEGDWRASFDTFAAALEKIKASGVTPMALEEYAIIWQIFAWWQAQTLGGSAAVAELVSGKRNFSDAPLPQVTQSWQKLKDYTVPGAESMPGEAAVQQLLAGQAVMTTGGFWAIPQMREGMGDKLGMIQMPNFSADAPIQNGGIGGAGTAYIVSNYSAVKDEAVAFLKFLMSKEEQELKAKSGQGSLLNVTDVDATSLYPDPLTNIQQGWATEPSTVFWLDNLYPSDLTNEIKAQSQLAWTSQISADEFLAKIDAKRDELLGA